MRNIITLVKKDLQISYAYFFNFSQALKDKKLRKKLLMQIFVLGLLIFYGAIFLKPVLMLYHTFALLDMELAYLALGLMAFGVTVLMFSFPYILSKIYLSRDVETLLSLPLTDQEILLSKFISLSLTSLFYALFTAFPFMIKLGLEQGKGLVYYLYGFIGIVLVSLGFISVLGLILIVLMLWAGKLPRFRNLVQVISMMLVMVLSLGINYYVQSSTHQSPGELMEKIAQGSKGLLEAILPALPNVRWLLLAMEFSNKLIGLGYFLILLVVTILVSYGVVRFFAPLMVKGVLTSKVVAEKKVRRPGVNRSSSVALHIFKKEFSDIIRTPLYAFNTLGAGVIAPLAFLVPAYAQGAISLEEIRKLKNYLVFVPLNRLEMALAALVLGLLIGIIMGSVGNPLSSSFSREGRHIWLMKSLPISAGDQLLGRLMLGVVFQLIIVAPFLILLTILLMPPAELVIALFLGNLLASVFVGLLGLSVDSIRPKLVWDNPQEAMKQNFNLAISMFSSWAYAGLMVYLVYKLQARIDIYTHLGKLMGAMLVLHLAIDLGLYVFLKRNLTRLIDRMEV